MKRYAAAVVAAEVLIRHGMGDDEVAAYVARTWPLDEGEARSVVEAAHVLLRREHTCTMTAPRSNAGSRSTVTR